MSRHRISEEWKKLVSERACHRCEYCQSPVDFSTQDFETDLVTPESKGGLVILENIAQACRGCNGHKFNKTKALDPLGGKIVPLFNPRKDVWSNHFAWDSDPVYLIGLTPTGRATIEALQLNRRRLLILRRNLQNIHRHPPVI